MAEYFKELTKINPLTFSQDKISANTNEEIVLLPASSLIKVADLNTSVDYFFVNNLKPSLKKIYPNTEFKIFF